MPKINQRRKWNLLINQMLQQNIKRFGKVLIEQIKPYSTFTEAFSLNLIPTIAKQLCLQQIIQINTIFLELIKNPFDPKDLIEFDDIQDSIRDVNRFNQLSEIEIKRFLSIGRGHYQCNNTKFKEILDIINVEGNKSCTLVLSLKLIVCQTESKLCFQQQLDDPIVIRQIINNLLYYHMQSYSISRQQSIKEICLFDMLNKTLNQITNENIQDIHYFNSTQFYVYRWNRIIYINVIREQNKISFRFYLNGPDQLVLTRISKSLFILRQEIIQKTKIFGFKSKKIIRIQQHPSFDSYDIKNGLLITQIGKLVRFHNISNLKLKYFIELPNYLQSRFFKVLYNMQKLIQLIDKKLYIYDIDQEHNCLTNLQILDIYLIKNYHLDNENNYILLFTIDRLVILDQYQFELKQINCLGKFNAFQHFDITFDMKYLYFSQIIEGKTSIQQISLFD